MRAVGNVVNLSTILGLVIAKVGRAQLSRSERGLILAEHYRRGFPKASAFTVGNVVIVPKASAAELARRLPEVLDHEDTHAWQYLYCLGLPFLPAYACAMAWSLVRTGDRAAANIFEVQADLTKGGYREVSRSWPWRRSS